MIFGHFGVAGAVHGFSRTKESNRLFVALLFAAFAPDWADVLYFLAGVCNPYGLYSHTVYAVGLEAAIVAGAAWLATRSARTTCVFAVVVLLHMPADYFTGQKLLVPGGDLVGLRLYWRPLLDFAVEAPAIVIGWLVLRWQTRGPAWARGGAVLAVLLAAQGAFDVVSVITVKRLKPSACFPIVSAAPAATGRRAVMAPS